MVDAPAVARSFSDTALRDLVSLEGRVAVITGGAGGLGLGVARRFAEAGANLVIADLDLGRAEAAAASLETTRAVATTVDASRADSHRDLASFAMERFGRLDIWVNNAGIYPFGPSLEVDEAHWRSVLSLDLDGLFYGAQAAGRAMVAAGRGGVVINLSSVAGLRGSPGATAYVAAKHGVEGVTKSLAAEWGGHGIRVVSIAPSLIRTPGTDAQNELRSTFGFGNDDFARMVPLGRIGEPDDIARVALFLASDLAAYVTGVGVTVDGGFFAKG